jgi:hypothetical protein
VYIIAQIFSKFIRQEAGWALFSYEINQLEKMEQPLTYSYRNYLNIMVMVALIIALVIINIVIAINNIYKRKVY